MTTTQIVRRIALQTQIIIALAAIGHIFGHADIGLAVGCTFGVFVNI